MPHNLHLLCLEWPAVATDTVSVGYIQNDTKGARDIVTTTTPARYLRRHWPTMPDHQIRDFVALHSAKCVVFDTVEDIVRSVQEGPRSCMQWSDEDVDSLGAHPYEVYAPEYGWRAVVRLEGGLIVGRALVLLAEGATDNDLKDAIFVRSYRRTDGYSGTDEGLEAWLTLCGANKEPDWTCGTREPRLKRIEPLEGRYDFVAPYIDGGVQHVADHIDYLVIDDDGEYLCNETGGWYEHDENRRTCDRCGERVDEDDGSYVGYDEATWVCSDCIERYYTFAMGRGGNEYYEEGDNVVFVGSQAYVREYIDRYDIVELDDGSYAYEEDAFRCPIDDAWYLLRYGVRCEDKDDDYVHRDNAWQDERTGLWYSDDTDCVVDAQGRQVLAEDEEDDVAEDTQTGDLFAEPDPSAAASRPVPDEPILTLPREYTHPLVASRGVRYRAGAVGRADVFNNTGNPLQWRAGVGENNSWLSDMAHDYAPSEWLSVPGMNPEDVFLMRVRKPPYPGWWNVMAVRPSTSGAFECEFNFWDGEKFTARRFGTDGRVVAEHNVERPRNSSGWCWRARHPYWSAQTRRFAEEHATPAPATTTDEWISWTAEVCPVPADTRVEVRFHCGETNNQHRAGSWRWGHRENAVLAHHIVAYRVLQPEPDVATSALPAAAWPMPVTQPGAVAMTSAV